MNGYIPKPDSEADRGTGFGRRGFTLIELLIVIAIVLILIAIALPNFLEAQVRAKVTKVKAEMQTTETALESYNVDWRGYPWGAELDAMNLPAMPPSEPIELHLPAVLTTPNAYLTSLFPDTFSNLFVEGSDQSIQAPFHYSEEETNKRLGDPELLGELTVLLFNQRRSAKYFILSHGPDGDHDDLGVDRGPEIEGGGPALYSPTNGSKSNGDIYFFGPGIGMS